MTPTAEDLQYVVLLHTGYGEDHFDLMLDVGETYPLLTFRTPAWPILEKVQLIPLGEHRRAYLSYEGRVSGDRGEVKQIARGTYDLAGDGNNILVTFTSGTDHKPLVITDDACAVPAAEFSA